nr:kelch-like protein 3 [Dermatophagoides farinae]
MDIEEENDIFDEYHQKHQQQQSMIIGTSSSLSPMVVETSSSSSSSFNNNSITGLLWNSSNNLAQMYRMRPKLCDVCLVTDDGCHIYAHRAILSSSMHYFSTMFIGQDFSTESTNCIIDDHADSRINNISSSSSSTSTTASASTSYNVNFIEQNQYQISIKNLDGNSLNEIIKYCYLGIVNINETNVQMLLSAATMLNCKDIIKICCEFLRSKLQTSNAIGIYSFAEIMGCKDLKDFTFAFILQNFVQIFQNDEFIQLSTERVVEIISSDYLDTGDEGEHIVLAAVINWIMFDYNERRQYLSQLIEHIRFPRFNQEELINIENEYPLVKNEPASKDLLIEALKYHLMKNSYDINSLLLTSTTVQQCNDSMNDEIVDNDDDGKLKNYPLLSSSSTSSWNNKNLSSNLLKNIPKVFDLTNARFRERISRTRQQCLIVIGGQAPKAICQCEYFDFSTNKWNEFICELPSRRCRSGIVVHHGLIYAIGGFNGQCRIRSVDMFDPKSNKWTQCASLEVKRSTLGACVLNGLIYAVGGFDGTLGLQSAEVYNPITRSWRFIEPMTTRRSSVAVVTLNGLLYAVGGYDGSSRQCLSSVECYNPEIDHWKRIPDMSQRRSGAGVEVLYEKIYAIGGHDGPAIRKSVECYDPTTNQWSQCADMIYARRNAVVVSNDGLLYVVGGEDGQTNLKSVEVYDPKSNSWSLLSSEMSIGRSYAGVAVIEKTWP